MHLKKMFENVEEGKSELVDELLKKAAFLKIELIIIMANFMFVFLVK